MRKLVKKAVNCKCCGQTKEDAVYDEFCDQCGEQINTEKYYPLHMTVWPCNSSIGTSRDVYLCSWKCVRAYLITNQKKLQKIDFISLPYPSRKQKGKQQCCDFINDFFKDFLLVEAKETKKVEP